MIVVQEKLPNPRESRTFESAGDSPRNLAPRLPGSLAPWLPGSLAPCEDSLQEARPGDHP